jgi:NDP-sugar pyrophosphorylase family protein
MVALLLCAGFGTRLRPLTDETPKGLLEVAERPIIDYLIQQMADWPDLGAIHLLTNEQETADYLRWWQSRWHRALKARGLTFHLHGNEVRGEDEQRGAVGDLAYLWQRIGRFENAVVASGDCIYRFPLKKALHQFREGEHNLALALHQPDAEKLHHQSVFQLDDGSDRVTGLVHEADDPPSAWTSPAFYFLKRTALRQIDDYLGEGGDPDTLGRFVDYLARCDEVRAARVPPLEYDGEASSPLTESELRFHINTPEDYERANDVLADEPLMTYE